MTAPWHALRIEKCADRDAVIGALFAAGSQGVQEEDEALVTHFPPEADIDDIVARISATEPDARIVVSDAPVVDWSVWRANVGAHAVGSLVVTPPWLAQNYDAATTIVIDPAMAFGTGEHATTRGMLRLMQRVVRAGDVVADLGAGSAVLSIAAAKLGASRVAAIEVDPDAASTAEENIAINDVTGVVSYLVGDATVLLELVAPVRVILANIVSSVLMEIVPSVRRSLTEDGVALLSGILLEEREMMIRAALRAGLQVSAEDVEGDWWSVALVPAASAA